jgi:osmotically-inducible protein OsmY
MRPEELDEMKKTSLAAACFLALLGLSVAACGPTPTRESTGEVVDDSVITAKVKAALINEPDTKAYQISVDTFRGIVQLSGFVDSTEARGKAKDVAQNVNGVKEVRNSLEVKQST